jgi:hypothetical protein
MKKLSVVFLVCLFLTNCASVNPYELSEGEGAYLENTAEQIGKARYIYSFANISTSEGFKSFGDAGLTKLTVPTGNVALGIDIRYFPEGNLSDLSFMENMELTTKALALSSEAQARHDYLNYGIGVYVFNGQSWEGIKLEVLEGETYKIKSEISKGKAFIWIEDSRGTKVSETFRGYGLRSGDYWLWETLPDPVE